MGSSDSLSLATCAYPMLPKQFSSCRLRAATWESPYYLKGITYPSPIENS